jgi:hypothetical protein
MTISFCVPLFFDNDRKSGPPKLCGPSGPASPFELRPSNGIILVAPERPMQASPPCPSSLAEQPGHSSVLTGPRASCSPRGRSRHSATKQWTKFQSSARHASQSLDAEAAMEIPHSLSNRKCVLLVSVRKAETHQSCIRGAPFLSLSGTIPNAVIRKADSPFRALPGRSITRADRVKRALEALGRRYAAAIHLLALAQSRVW